MRSSDIRERSRSARERSTSLRVTSKQLRDSLGALHTHRFKTDPSLPDQWTSSPEHSFRSHDSFPRSSMDFAVSIQQRVHKARHEAQALRRRAADLRNQAAAFRTRAQNLRRGAATQ